MTLEPSVSLFLSFKYYGHSTMNTHEMTAEHLRWHWRQAGQISLLHLVKDLNRVLAICLMALATGPAFGQTKLHVQAPGDVRYFQEQIDVVEWVQDRQSADVSVLVIRDRAGATNRFTAIFYGGVTDTLETTLEVDASESEDRDAMLQLIKAGLTRYLVQRDAPIRIIMSSPQARPIQVVETEDPWNAWVFNTSVSSNGNGQASRSSVSRRASFTANQTTEERIITVRGTISRFNSSFDLPDGSTFESTTKSGSVRGDLVFTTGSHSGVGIRGSWSQNSINNTENQFYASAQAEYNLYPYTDSRTRALTFNYAVELTNYNYVEETLFNELNENVLSHRLLVSLDLTKKWGSIGGRLTGKHNLTNFDRRLTDSYNLGVFINTSLRLSKGLSIRAFANASRVRDQLYLPLASATEEEILTGSISLPTGWNLFYNLTLSYRFGSIYNSAVNSRLGF